MNSILSSEFSLVNSEVTTRELLKLAAEMYPEAAPRTRTDAFLREGGLGGIEYIDFILAVEQNFRVGIPLELASGIDCVAALAAALHSGELTRWG